MRASVTNSMSIPVHSQPGKVVVITGASSGLGRAAAIELGRHGCRVVLAARGEVELRETARLCVQAGGTATVVRTDVTVATDVQNLARLALDTYGEIDVWVNNAGVTLFGLLSDASFEDHERVIRTNLFGAIHGARVILPYFKTRGRGIVINVCSVLAEVGQPFVPSYVISKFGLRGMSEALRVEVAEHPEVHVCTLMPYTIDTPHFESGANFVGKQSRALPPIQSPEKVARALVDLMARPRRELHVPKIAALGVALHWLAPRTAERVLLRALRRFHFDVHAEAPTTGNVKAPIAAKAATVHGHRRPLVSTLGFAAWVAADFVKMELESVSRLVRRWREPKQKAESHARTPSDSTAHQERAGIARAPQMV